MEILDDQPLEKPPYEKKGLLYGISGLCGMVTLGAWLVKKPNSPYAWGEFVGSMTVLWFIAAIYYLVWKAFKLNVNTGILLFVVLLVLVLMSQYSAPQH